MYNIHPGYQPSELINMPAVIAGVVVPELALGHCVSLRTHAPLPSLRVRSHRRSRCLPSLALARLVQSLPTVTRRFVRERSSRSLRTRFRVSQVVETVDTTAVVLTADVEVQSKCC